MIEKGLFTEMATINAKAIQDLNPQICVWNTSGAGGEGGSDPYATIRNVFQAMPPILSTVQQQTGITPPQFLGTLPDEKPKRRNN